MATNGEYSQTQKAANTGTPNCERKWIKIRQRMTEKESHTENGCNQFLLFCMAITCTHTHSLPTTIFIIIGGIMPLNLGFSSSCILNMGYKLFSITHHTHTHVDIAKRMKENRYWSRQLQSPRVEILYIFVWKCRITAVLQKSIPSQEINMIQLLDYELL